MFSIRNLLARQKLTVIILASLLTTVILMLLVRLPLLTGGSAANINVTEQNGIYDLTGIADFNGTIIRLAPGSTYYPAMLLTPQTVGAAVPMPVNKYNGIRTNYLSQRFILKLPDNSAVYTLTFKLSGRHAMKVYINGSLAGQAGKPGTTKQDTEVWENHITCDGAAADGKMDIILNSAQFHHSKKGASLAELSLSKSGTAADTFFFDQIKGLLMTGALLSAAIILLGIYLLLSHTKATLYFSLACIAMALRELLTSQAWTYFPIPGNLSFMLEYISVVLLTVFLSLYLGQYAAGKFLRSIQYTAITGSCIYGLILLSCDSLFYTSVLKYYQVLLVICIIPGITGLFRIMRRPTIEQAAVLYGIGVFYLAALSDIIMYSDILGDGTNFPISEMSMLVFVLAQTISLFLMNNRVLSEVKHTGQKLAAEKEALENLNRMKTEFLGNVSHELKTPLTVMSGYAQTTRQLAGRPGQLDGAEISRRMKLISSEAERLSLMVGQILDVTRMEEGRMAMERLPCHVDEIIHAAIETHYPMLNKNENRLEIHIENGLPSVNADPSRISQIIVNLISNAVRYTKNGLITVSAKHEDAQVVICVADTGAGISQDRFPHIFERYNHKQKSGGGQNTGTGLGLYICKHIVEQHGGRIWLESEEGRGTSVFFTLPVP